MNKTSIAWTDYTSNPIRARNIETGKTGHYCTHVSEGCEHCYAGTWNAERFGTGLDFIAQNRDKVEVYLNEDELREWSKPKYAGKRVFVADMTDWCHELVTDEMRDQILATMLFAHSVTFQLLTKRPERMRDYLNAPGVADRIHDIVFSAGPPIPAMTFWPLPNVWLGVTAENQRWADERIPILLDTPAAVRFVSYEPALGPLNLQHIDTGEQWNGAPLYASVLKPAGLLKRAAIDWIIVGGESGATPRPFEAQWARDVRDQCRKAGVAYFMKQMGGKRFPDDRLESLPEDLRVREFPS